jgi:hypothetical protein
MSIILGIFIHTKQVFKNDLRTSHISIHGTAEEEIKADLLTWKFEYSTVGDKVEEVKQSAKEAKIKIIEMLTSAGLEQDVDFEVRPKSLKHSKTDDGKNVFTISQTYEVNSSKLEEAEKAFKSSAYLSEEGIGITTCKDATYCLKDPISIERKLMPMAVQNATNRAEELAASQGCKIVSPPGIEYSYSEFRDKNAARGSGTYSGTNTKVQLASLTVTVTFKTVKADKNANNG